MPRPLDPRSAEPHSLADKIAHNIWDHIGDVFKVLKAVQQGQWCWTRNPRCKYIDVRIDMRDGGCLIKDRDGNRISPEQLMYQYGRDNPNEPSQGAPHDARSQDPTEVVVAKPHHSLLATPDT